jgi:WD40 repeat protein
VKVWDTTSGQELATLPTNGPVVVALAFAPDSRSLAIGCGEWRKPGQVEVKVWDLTTRQVRTTLPVPPGLIHRLAFNPDGTELATAGGDTVRLWDLTTGQQRLVLRDIGVEVTALAFSPDGKRLVTGTTGMDLGRSGGLKLWDTLLGQEVLTLDHSGNLESLAFSPDGRYLFTGTGSDPETMLANRAPTEVKVWDAGPDARTPRPGNSN